MKHIFKKYCSLALLLSTGLAIAECCDTDCNTTCNTSCNNADEALTMVTNCFLPRSQSRNDVIKTSGLDPRHEHLFDQDCVYGTFNIGVEYTQSFRNKRIAECLFGPAAVSIEQNTSTNSDDCCSSDCEDGVMIKVVGSLAGANGTTDLLADAFLLPRDFSSTITISPKITNINVPMQLYVGLDNWHSGLYFRVYAPVTHTRWKLEAEETIINQGSNTLAAGILSPSSVPASSLYQSFLDYTSGGTIAPLPGITPTTAIKVDPLMKQRIAKGCEAQTKTGLADLRAEFGWDFVLNECYHVGLNIQGAAPTGNECSDSCFLFAPIVGNNKHWELGGGLTGHYTFWRSEDEERQCGFYIDADITHMFKKSETRVFDLKNKPLSRYMFAQKLTKADPFLVVGSTTPNLQFANEFAPVANFAMEEVDISFDVQGEVLAKFVYSCYGFDWEVGYNFWGRSCQKVDIGCECGPEFPERTWGLVGNAHLFGFEDDSGAPHDLSATVSGATAFNGDNGTTVVQPNNIGVDNPGLASFDDAPLTTTLFGGTQINGSNPAIAITADDLDIHAGTRGISHKVFTNFNYTWTGCENWTPYLGVGASAEFGSTGENNDNDTNVSTVVECPSLCNAECGDHCSDCAVSQWAVWVKGGVSF